MKKPILIVFTGAGVSAESGLATFRASDGLWENHRIEDAASPDGWRRNPALVLDFYNQRRMQAMKAEPNAAHRIIAKLETHFEVQVITQNVDNLHERAGCRDVIHLHGSLFQARCTGPQQQVMSWEKELLLPGDLSGDGYQLRPHIVWFGEDVPMMEPAAEKVQYADAMLVIGTSLQVYPAASLLHYLPVGKPLYFLNPHPALPTGLRARIFTDSAVNGLPEVRDALLAEFGLTGD